MNDYFTLNNLFNDKQYGFRKYHSTKLAALNVVDTIGMEIHLLLSVSICQSVWYTKSLYFIGQTYILRF